jgi:hypothetical protein
MSATPIPRTLSLGLSALRDMSILNTPPPGRRPVRTVCDTFSPSAVRAAIGAELARGGQAFYVVPRISQIEAVLELLAELFPGAAVEYAHGQCADLEARMLRFAEGQARVLVSTSVVECGIDMPNVNTLLVQDAHMFGLASLHQLRGRVGRSSTQVRARELRWGLGGKRCGAVRLGTVERRAGKCVRARRGLRCDAMRCAAMRCDGIGKLTDRIGSDATRGWDGMDGMGSDGMGWDRTGWDGTGCEHTAAALDALEAVMGRSTRIGPPSPSCPSCPAPACARTRRTPSC